MAMPEVVVNSLGDLIDKVTLATIGCRKVLADCRILAILGTHQIQLEI
jgi:hypothetical protein